MDDDFFFRSIVMMILWTKTIIWIYRWWYCYFNQQYLWIKWIGWFKLFKNRGSIQVKGTLCKEFLTNITNNMHLAKVSWVTLEKHEWWLQYHCLIHSCVFLICSVQNVQSHYNLLLSIHCFRLLYYQRNYMQAYIF